MEARRDVFQAIADPTRRDIMAMLVNEPINVNTIAAQFSISRQAISLHLKILSECGLINITLQGRERLCEAKFEQLTEVQDWVNQYHKLWSSRLSALKEFVEQETSPLQSKKQTSKKITSKTQKSKYGKPRKK